MLTSKNKWNKYCLLKILKFDSSYKKKSFVSKSFRHNYYKLPTKQVPRYMLPNKDEGVFTGKLIRYTPFIKGRHSNVND